MTPKSHFGDRSDEFLNRDTAGIVIVPVAYDGTSTWIKGADKGPAAILEASANLEFYDIETDAEVCKRGIYTDDIMKNFTDPQQMVETVDRRVAGWLSREKFTVTIGGEHSVSIGAAKAHADKIPDITVLQLDAHADLRDKYLGSEFNHACVMARIRQLCPIVQVGIRSMDISEKQYVKHESLFYAQDIHNHRDWIEKVTARLSDNVYITIDLDVFDPSIMPSTGTPEPGGLLWHDVLALLKKTAQTKNIVGFDIVELCPNPHNKAPDFLAAKLLYTLLTYKFCL
ncbi:MAG: agmatinase [Sedimentisphaerales bacterium]|nr:agmatinase [Sedimentisphaerales bacterium]